MLITAACTCLPQQMAPVSMLNFSSSIRSSFTPVIRTRVTQRPSKSSEISLRPTTPFRIPSALNHVILDRKPRLTPFLVFQSTRAVYNKQGKKKAGEPGGEDVDPMQMFVSLFSWRTVLRHAHVACAGLYVCGSTDNIRKTIVEFTSIVQGGEAFVDWVGEISLFKDFAKMADISTTEEEKEQLRKEMGDTTVATADGQPAPSDAADAAQTTAAAEAEDLKKEKPAASSTVASWEEKPKDKPHPADASPVASGSTTPTTAKSQKEGKLTAEQREQLSKMGDERAKEREERIRTLARKLVDRCRTFEQATKPGDADDSETKNFQKRISEETEDMKTQSFGIELLQLIGAVYMSKASTYLKLHKGLQLCLTHVASHLILSSRHV